jgi:D-alanyl-D-alanine carboxypeptidase
LLRPAKPPVVFAFLVNGLAGKAAAVRARLDSIVMQAAQSVGL